MLVLVRKLLAAFSYPTLSKQAELFEKLSLCNACKQVFAVSQQSRNSLNYRNVFSVFQMIIFGAEATISGIEKKILVTNINLQNPENARLDIDS